MSARFGRKRIFLMRHGHVDYFSDEVLKARDHTIARLTNRGRAQAVAAGEALKSEPLDLAICSGYPRTRETAEIVLAARVDKLELTDEPAFVELKGGTLRFASREDAASAMQDQFRRAGEPGARMFGGESFAAAQMRSVSALETLLVAPSWTTALIVAHEGINRVLISWALGAGLHAAPRIEQDTACINVLDFDIGPDHDDQPMVARAIVKVLNATPYDWLKAGMRRTSLEDIFHKD